MKIIEISVYDSISKYYLCKDRIFKTLVRTTSFSKKGEHFLKILHMPQTALISTVLVGCMYGGVSTVYV